MAGGCLLNRESLTYLFVNFYLPCGWENVASETDYLCFCPNGLTLNGGEFTPRAG